MPANMHLVTGLTAKLDRAGETMTQLRVERDAALASSMRGPLIDALDSRGIETSYEELIGLDRVEIQVSDDLADIIEKRRVSN